MSDVTSLKDLVKNAKEHAKDIQKDGVKTHQIRNFFAAVERMRRLYKNNPEDEQILMELILLQPKLAYTAGRQPNSVGKSFFKHFSTIIDQVLKVSDRGNQAETREQLKGFFAYTESIVAYHKYFEKVKTENHG
ncbi:MAG TPA: type III-A CRISPR-associated protein Csm2 [Saprospiraceae bacterium]|nr:type III-A CRISPR-associated protein Csm2 [Saprospiraceae bacterium]HMQ81517.1 type III-A CRISPR-associated protein Csm2 [Saprospiraceae bacterium]